MFRAGMNSVRRRGGPVKELRPAGEPVVRAGSRPAAQDVARAAAAVWLAGCVVLHVMTGITVFSLFSVAPLIVATVADERRTAIFAGAAVVLTVGSGGGGATLPMRSTGPG
jgi:hypothetical protein